MGEIPLKDAFPSIYRLVVNQQVSVTDSFDFVRSCWDPNLRRNLNDWEIGEMMRLHVILENIVPSLDGLDGWIWKLKSKNDSSPQNLTILN